MKKIIITIPFLGFMNASQAQYQLFQVGWNIAIPSGELRDFIDETSTRGFYFGGRHFIFDFVSVGGSFGWQTFNTKFTGTQEIDNAQITGTQYKYINAYPLQFNSHYYLGDDGGIRPYIGTSVGVTWVNQRVDLGIFTSSDTSTHFAIAPEIGVVIPIGVAGVGAMVAAKYEQAFKSSNNFHVPYLSINISVAFLN